MSKYICRTWGALMASAVVLGACSSEKKPDTLAQDTTLNKDLQLARTDTAAQPQLSDVPKPTTTPAPVERRTARQTIHERTTTPSRTITPTPRTSTTPSGNMVTRTPGGKATALGTIPAGSTLTLASNSRVCTNTNHVGDHITATVSNAVTGSNGAVIPSGATATLEVTELKRSENVNDKIVMGFRILSVSFGGHSYPVDGTVASAQVDRVKNQPSSKDVQKVATGAAVGAVVGRILGKSTKSTIIGGAVGAAAGAGAAAATANYEGCVPQGGRITVTLNNSLQVHT